MYRLFKETINVDDFESEFNSKVLSQIDHETPIPEISEISSITKQPFFD